MDEHADIDLLCDDRKILIKITGADNVYSSSSGREHNRKISIAGKIIHLDIRTIGDGYYCEEWEKNMLSERKMYNNLCYVMNDEIYFYSLIYHALIHKKSVSPDYIERLQLMGKNLNLAVSHDKLLSILENYMTRHKYTYTYTSYAGGIINLNHAGINKNIIQRFSLNRFKRACSHGRLRIRKILSKILRTR